MGAAYPKALKIFTSYHDFSDTIWAVSINEIHDEIIAIEKLLGVNPFGTTGYTTFSQAIQDLYSNKAPSAHLHSHSSLVGDNTSDDHLMYVRVDASRGFTRPVSGQPATASTHLVPLHQLQALGYITASQATAIAEGTIDNLVAGAIGGGPLFGPVAPAPDWTIQGGTFQGCTNAQGTVTVPFDHTYSTQVQAFVCTKIPAPGGQACPPYNYIEAQVTLVYIDKGTARVQFSHDYSWQPGMWVAFTWIAIGYE